MKLSEGTEMCFLQESSWRAPTLRGIPGSNFPIKMEAKTGLSKEKSPRIGAAVLDARMTRAGISGAQGS
jgi:hypothetical protein